MFTVHQLQDHLAAAGLKHSDSVLIHSSATAIGEVENGVEGILDAFIGFFGRKGLCAFPAMTYTLMHNWRPETYWCQHCGVPEKYCFAHGLALTDVRRFFADMPTCVGALSNQFLKRPGVCRSLSVTSSVAAVGADAKDFTSGHELCQSGCSRGSPWWKMLERQGKILLVGVPMENMTYLHGLGEWCRPDSFLPPNFDSPFEIYDKYGAKVNSRECRPVARFIGGDFANAEPPLRQGGAITDCTLGNARTMIVDCQKAFLIMKEYLKTDPQLTGYPAAAQGD